ncbi:MAG: GTP 3',8-cyclase MoaA [Spirochaetaceae bacterium]|nr:GTP 3',8-cyclase MoaA [Spirochaetaceae bacterium]
MQDGFGRNIDYLRVSVTDKCNLRCVYCMPPDGVKQVRHSDMLRFEEVLRVCSAAARLGVCGVKVTGGEPLVRRGLTGFIRALKQSACLKNVTLTTNGLLLSGFLDELLEAGIDAVNVSLDTLNKDVFRAITRSDGFEQVLYSIHAAQEASISLKINAVPMRGVNEADIVPLAELARQKNVHVRFIELMPLGLGARILPIPQAEVKAALTQAFGTLEKFEGRLGNGPASYYSAAGFAGKIGFISALSHSFCGSCNRLRLTGTGLLKTCLSSDIGVDLKAVIRSGGSDAAIDAAFRSAVMLKPAGHDFHTNQHVKKNMYSIGG